MGVGQGWVSPTPDCFRVSPAENLYWVCLNSGALFPPVLWNSCRVFCPLAARHPIHPLPSSCLKSKPLVLHQECI